MGRNVILQDTRQSGTWKDGPGQERDVSGFTSVKLPDQLGNRECGNSNIQKTFCQFPTSPGGAVFQTWSLGPPLKRDAKYLFTAPMGRDVI